MNIKNAVDAAYHDKSLKEVADSPVSALQGVSEADADYLYKAFQIKTVRDFAKLRFFRWAQSIVTLADTEI
jgi:hypothetical protein